ncbi:MAG: sigma-70 family RNA polymerase sigma factor [Gemmataceae bacterium]
MASDSADYSPAPERFRDYLLFLARSCLGWKEQARLSPSDVVQQTLLEAHQKQHQFRGHTDAEMAAWLRQMLAYRLADAQRALGRALRDVSRECSLEAMLDDSSARMGSWLAGEQSSPSDHAVREEELLRLAGALAQLPTDQQQAVERKHLHGQTIAAIAQEMGRTEAAVGGLLRRGMTQLRELLAHDSES